MDRTAEAELVPKVFLADEGEGYLVPPIIAAGDRGGGRFAFAATLTVPKLLYLLEQPAGEGAFTHLAVDVISTFFGAHHAWEYEVSIALDGKPLDRRLFHTWYGRHQFLIPLSAFRCERHRISLTATPIATGDPADGEPSFDAELLLTAKPRIWSELERRAVWVFSTARSGSTWVAADLLCAFGESRIVDEPGIGRMFAPLRWDPEHLFDEGLRYSHLPRCSSRETGALDRDPAAFPLFEPAFANLRQENQILSRHNYDYYHKTLQDVAFGHVLNEWGLRDYSLLVFKMPNDSQAADAIMRACPQSFMVFLMRDGRDVMRSRFSPFSSELLATTTDRELRRYAIWFYAHLWNFQVDTMRAAFEAQAPERRFLIRYEDLRRHPAEWVTRLYQHIAASRTVPHLKLRLSREQIARLAERTRLENFPESERGPDKPRQSGEIGGYRDAFDEGEIALMNAIMGPNLQRYGYDIPETDAGGERPVGLPLRRIDQLERELQAVQRHLGDVLASTKAPLAGYARQIGNSAGLFHDGWAGRELSLRLSADRPITGVTVKGVIPPELPQLSRAFDIEVDGELFAFWLHDSGSFAFHCPTLIPAGAVFDLIVRCDSEVNASAIGAVGDRRNLAYRLTQLELDHAPAARRRGRNS